ncbi:MAG: flagellar basal-body rod protein FlgF [Deltaproteobacteria bacterium]|nr:flagellar basal-body rod protein FlgF [Deltaproteobacteria bacterium]
MSSGYYSALSGAVSRMQALDILSNNLSNVGTPGFKRSAANFGSYLDEASQASAAEGINYTFIRGVVPDMSDGTAIETGNSLHMAIMGEGFFKVQDEKGVFYTRQGNFKLNPDGLLLSPTGHQVMGEGGPITLNTSEITVGKDGTIGTVDGSAGRIILYTFDDPSILSRMKDGVFKAPDGVQGQIVDEPSIMQGRLEGSNVSLLEEMAQMVAGTRYFESYEKVMKSYSDLAAKANQIGLLG